jgi:hypothetical protein
MPGSVTSVFIEPKDFKAAFCTEGCRSLVVTGHGQFRARLPQVALHLLRLSMAQEQPARIAFLAIPPGMVVLTVPVGTG